MGTFCCSVSATMTFSGFMSVCTILHMWVNARPLSIYFVIDFTVLIFMTFPCFNGEWYLRLLILN